MTKKNQHSFEDFLGLQRVSPKTREAYLRSVSALSAYHKQPAAELTNEQIQDYLLFLHPEKTAGLGQLQRAFLWSEKILPRLSGPE